MEHKPTIGDGFKLGLGLTLGMFVGLVAFYLINALFTGISLQWPR